MSPDKESQPSDPIREQAAEWIIKNRTDNINNSAFDAWLRESPAHIRAYLEMAATWEDTSLLRSVSTMTAEELIARARGDGNVVSLEARGAGGHGQAIRPPAGDSRTSWAKHIPGRAVFAAAILIACLCYGFLIWSARPLTYTTALGEQRSVTLEDGSTLELDTQTRIEVRFTARERAVELLEGQALFRVTKNDRQPFVVRAGDMAARAVGTEFDVYRKRSGITLTVTEGRIAVTLQRNANSAASGAASGSGSTSSVVFVSAGELSTVIPSGISRPAQANVSASLAWTGHRLVFDSAPLFSVVEEFNRYQAGKLIIDDPRLSTLQISGVFSSTEPAVLIQFLRLQPEVSIRESGADVHIGRK